MLIKTVWIPNFMFPAKFDCSTHTYTPNSQQKHNSVNHLHTAPTSCSTLCRPHRHEKTAKQLVGMLWGIKWCRWEGKRKHIHSHDSTEPDVMPGIFSKPITTLLECHWTSWRPSPSWKKQTIRPIRSCSHEERPSSSNSWQALTPRYMQIGPHMCMTYTSRHIKFT